MSFDLQIKNGDLQIGSNGDVAQVFDTEKLVQDILKILLTQIGANTFFPWYGSPLTTSVIGNVLDEPFLESVATGQVRNGIEMIQKLQREQSKNQRITAAETIAAIRDVRVIRNLMDPSVYEVRVSVLTKSLRTTTTSFNVTL